MKRLFFLASLVGVVAACAGEPAKESGMEEPLAVEEGMIEVMPGLELYYRTVGDGPQTVVIPAALFLENEFNDLARDRRLIFYDMRNRGRSSSVPEPRLLRMQYDVSDLEAVRMHFGLESMSLVGWSYLGLMVALYAIDHPERVDRIVQIDPIPPRSDAPYREGRAGAWEAAADPQAVERLARLEEQGLKREDPRAFYEEYWAVWKPALFGDTSTMSRYQLPPADMENEWLHNLDVHFAAHFASFAFDYDVREDASQLEIPVLTIHGTADRNAVYEGGREWAVTFPQARLLIVQGAAHLPFVEQPELVIPAMDVFLDGQWPAQARDMVTPQ